MTDRAGPNGSGPRRARSARRRQARGAFSATAALFLALCGAACGDPGLGATAGPDAGTGGTDDPTDSGALDADDGLPDRGFGRPDGPDAATPGAATESDAGTAADAVPVLDDGGAAPADPGDAGVPPPVPDDDPPPLPECPCFVREAWCGAGAAAHGLTLDPPCRVPLSPDHDADLLACDGERWIVREVCTEGCSAAPPGVPDACRARPGTPENPGWDDCPRRGLLHFGLHPEASDRLRCAGVNANRITQTIGNAAASAGYHAEDGRAGGEPYCAAVDLATRDLNRAEIRDLLDRLGRNGFAAWYRQPGADGWPAGEAPHIHAVFAGVRMKAELRGQVRDFLRGRNGLASHSRYDFWRAPDVILDRIRLLFSRHYDP